MPYQTIYFMAYDKRACITGRTLWKLFSRKWTYTFGALKCIEWCKLTFRQKANTWRDHTATRSGRERTNDHYLYLQTDSGNCQVEWVLFRIRAINFLGRDQLSRHPQVKSTKRKTKPLTEEGHSLKEHRTAWLSLRQALGWVKHLLVLTALGTWLVPGPSVCKGSWVSEQGNMGPAKFLPRAPCDPEQFFSCCTPASSLLRDLPSD